MSPAYVADSLSVAGPRSESAVLLGEQDLW
jgi:hypothetical protein